MKTLFGYLRSLRIHIVLVIAFILVQFVPQSRGPANLAGAFLTVEAIGFICYCRGYFTPTQPEEKLPIVATSSRRVTGAERQKMIEESAQYLNDVLGVLSPGVPHLREHAAVLVDAFLMELAIPVTDPIRP